MAFITATFTDVAGTLITGYTSDSGHTWTLHPATGASSNSQISNANRYRNGSSTKLIVAYPNASPAGADYDVEADLVYKTDVNQTAGILGRLDTGADTWYELFHDTSGASHQWRLRKSVAGTTTNLGSNTTQTLTVDQNYRAKLSLSGTTILATVDGVTVCATPITDASISAAGKPGIRFNAIAATDTTSTHIDNFIATDAVVTAVGIGWFAPRENDIRSAIVRTESPAGFAPQAPSAPASTIAGMAWFEPPDRDRPAARRIVEEPSVLGIAPPRLPAFGWYEARTDDGRVPLRMATLAPAFPGKAPTAATVPISGMAWFAPRENDLKAPVAKDIAPAFAPKPPAAIVNTVSGIAWFAPRENDVKPPVAKDIAPAFAPKPPTAIVNTVSGMAWFEAPDDRRRALPVYGEGVPAFPVPVSQIVLGAWWARPFEGVSRGRIVASGEPPSNLSPVLRQSFGWFLPREGWNARRRTLSDPPASVFIVTASSPPVVDVAARPPYVTCPAKAVYTVTPDRGDYTVTPGKGRYTAKIEE